MAVSTPAHVTPDALRWARESAGYTLEAAAAKIGVRPEKLERAELGEELLTLRQAERAADVFDRPLAALFLPTPPAEEPQEAQFRRLPGAPEPPWPPEMLLLSRRVRDRQDAATELYDLLDEPPPWREIAAELPREPQQLAGRLRELLGIPLEEQESWRDPSGYRPLREWVDAIEGLGVLVVQDGTMGLEFLRGFASAHPDVPAVVVNTQDDPRARAFTAVHELGHHALLATGHEAGPRTEGWCNEFAGEVLMPRAELARVFGRSRRRDPLDRVDDVALRFGVTPYAAAVRGRLVGLLPRDEADSVIARIRDRGGRARGSGGDYYRTQLGRLGPGFVRLVFSALDGQALTYPAASSLLGVKVSNFDKLRTYLSARAQP